HYQPSPSGTGPSWLTFLGHLKDSLWSIDLFRCESATLRTYWVLVVMGQFTRTHSTLMNELKVDPKLVADQLGHMLDVNQNVYTLPNLARRQEAVNMLETAIQNAS